MSSVVNMHQRRTVATGRQNQDPNTAVVSEKEKTPKQARPQLERSIEEVLNHTRNTSGRGRQMVLAALQKQQAAEKTSPAAAKASQPGKNSGGRNAKKNSEGARSAVVPNELKGNKLSISDNRKRPLDQEETRAPLSALNGSTLNNMESDWTSTWTASPAKPSPRGGTAVYTSKRQKTAATPPTPPLKSSSRRQEMKATSTPPPPVVQSNSPHLRSRRQDVQTASPPPPPVFQSKSPHLRSRRQEIQAASPPPPPVFQSKSPHLRSRRQEIQAASPPPPPVFQSKSPHLRSRRQDVQAASPPPPPIFESRSSHVRNEKTSLPEASKPIVEHVAEKDSLQPVRRQLISPTKGQRDSHDFSSERNIVEERKALAILRELDTQVLEVETEPSSSFIPESPETEVPEAETQPSFSSSPKSPGTQVPEAETQTNFSLSPRSARRLHGLMNLGNTCYMNVIVQILCNLPSFVNGMERFFGPIVSQNVLEGSESFPDVESVHAALLKVFRDLKRAERFETVNPTLLKHAFAQHQSSFWGCIQQDAHEFFCSLIDKVQEDVSSALKKQYSVEADRSKLETVCPTTQNFSCSVRNNLTCAGCGNVSSVEETYRDFSLALPEDERTDESTNCSLGSLLNLYFQETTMSRKCEKCGVEDTKAKAQILKLPHVLVLQLKRLHMDRDIPCTKVSAPVKFTSRLDIGPWCAKDKQKFWSPTTDNVHNSNGVESMTSNFTTESELRSSLASSFELESQELPSTTEASSSSADLSTCYRLRGVVNHLGVTAFGGHFLTDILDPEADRWLRCDDSLVTDVSEETVFGNVREAYMFFYVHEAAG